MKTIFPFNIDLYFYFLKDLNFKTSNIRLYESVVFSVFNDNFFYRDSSLS